jgi:hypothetical protein
VKFILDLINNFIEKISSFKAASVSAGHEIVHFLQDFDGSLGLRYSQDSVTGYHPEPDECLLKM